MVDVLVVEDDHDLRVDLSFLLQSRGLQVAVAHNGEEALKVIQAQGAPRLMLLDLMMPDMDGWNLREVLLQHAALKGVPVVILSGTDNLEQEAALLHAAAWLQKPIDLDKLYGIVATYC